MLKEHNRSAAYPIRQDGSRSGYEPLRGRQAVERLRTLLVQFVYMRADGGVFHECGVEIFAHHMLGDIIFGGSQAARGKNDICTRKSIV